jgi:hypothetical protein
MEKGRAEVGGMKLADEYALERRRATQQSCNRAATELQQSCNRAATELQQSSRTSTLRNAGVQQCCNSAATELQQNCNRARGLVYAAQKLHSKGKAETSSAELRY